MESILRLDVAGRPHGWIGREAAAHAYATEHVIWGLGDATLVMRGGVQRATGRRSVIYMQPVIAIRGRVVKNFTPSLTNAALFKRDGYRCLYCGGRFDRYTLTRDHIRPSSRGGEDSWMNSASACRSCNQRKADRTPEAAGMTLLAIPFEPNIAEWHYLAKNRVQGEAFDYLAQQFSGRRDWAA